MTPDFPAFICDTSTSLPTNAMYEHYKQDYCLTATQVLCSTAWGIIHVENNVKVNPL